MYRLTTLPEQRLRLERLARSFDDPQYRDELYELVRSASEERRYREMISLRVGVFAMPEFETPII
ncbi:MAG: hypothetical protein NZ699_02835 [Roseiflexus sp.]|nr:hypothetical protein [Roseiflexus sp.]